MPLLTVFPNGIVSDGVLLENFSVSSVTANSNQTYTASMVVNGLVQRNPNGGDRTDTLPSAATLIQTWLERCNGYDPPIGAWFQFAVQNVATTDLRLTIAGGTGVTVLSPVVGFGASQVWKCVRTDTAAIVMVPTVAPFLQVDRAHTVASSINTANNVTYTADQLLGAIILRDCNGANRTDTTPTATAIIQGLAAYNGLVTVGTTRRILIRNTTGAAYTITVSGGTGVTISGTNTIAQNNTREFLLVVTNVSSPAVTLYSVGTYTH